MFKGNKMDIESEYCEYECNKLKFINDILINKPINTKRIKWTHFKSYVIPVEKKINRDLATFSEEDIDDLLAGVKSKNRSTIATVFELLSSYIDWTIEKEIRIKSNPMKNMSKIYYVQLNEENTIKRYYSMDDIFNLSEEAERRGISAQDIIIILLCRYRKITGDNDFNRLENHKGENQSEEGEGQEFPEGKPKSKLHIERERNRKVINIAKSKFKKKYGRLFCEVCGFDFSEIYGELGEDFIEGHHKKPIAQLKEGDTTKPEDIVMLCSNCHSMIHISDENLSVGDLKVIINIKDRKRLLQLT